MDKKTKKPVNPLAYLGEVREELNRVTWPTRAEVIRLSGVVIIASLIVGLYIGGVDFVFTNLISAIIK